MPVKAPLLDEVSQRSTSSKVFRAGIALFAGSCLVLLSVIATSAYSQGGTSAESTSLLGMLTSSRLTRNSVLRMTPRDLPGASPWKELALAGIEAHSHGQCKQDVSMNVFKPIIQTLSSSDRAVVVRAESKAQELLKAGVVAPLGFFDPAGFSANLDEGKILFYREAEIKHGRVCMLAFLGILVGENYHPLFGGNFDVAAVKVFEQQTLSEFWPFAFAQFMVMSFLEERRTSGPVLLGRAFGGINPNEEAEGFAAEGARLPGDLGFDPLGLKPNNEKDLIAIQNKELLNGRLAMIAWLGIVSQEMVTGQKVFR